MIQVKCYTKLRQEKIKQMLSSLQSRSFISIVVLQQFATFFDVCLK